MEEAEAALEVPDMPKGLVVDVLREPVAEQREAAVQALQVDSQRREEEQARVKNLEWAVRGLVSTVAVRDTLAVSSAALTMHLEPRD